MSSTFTDMSLLFQASSHKRHAYVYPLFTSVSPVPRHDHKSSTPACRCPLSAWSASEFEFGTAAFTWEAETFHKSATACAPSHGRWTQDKRSMNSLQFPYRKTRAQQAL